MHRPSARGRPPEGRATTPPEDHKAAATPPADHHAAETPSVGHPPPGTEQPRRLRPTLRYELLGCALHGHELLGTTSATVTQDDDLVVLEAEGLRFHRCLRCDSWLPLPVPTVQQVTRGDVPGPGEVEIPLRGRPLRDRFVLRLIAADRVVHFVLLAIVAVAIIAFADHRSSLQGDYTRILNRLQGAVGGPLSDSGGKGFLGELDRLFAIPTGRLYLYGAAIGGYAVINGIEAFGLWRARRWAEYLTLVEVAVLVPFEVYELTERISPLKILTLVINLAVVAYLLYSHRLFGLRGGGRADRAEKDRDTGWAALERTAPWQPARRSGLQP